MPRTSSRWASALGLAVMLTTGCVLDTRLGVLDGGTDESVGAGDPSDSEGPSDPSASGGELGGPGEIPPPDVEPVANTGVILDCDVEAGYEISSWRATEPRSPRLWIGGVYQTHGDHSGGNHPEGMGTVTWGLPGRNVLVLSSYEPVAWTVTLTEGAQLDRLILTGYHAQRAEVPAGVEVEIHTYEGGADDFACGHALPGDGGGCEGEELVDFAQRATGLPMFAFDGCYDASAFEYLPE